MNALLLEMKAKSQGKNHEYMAKLLHIDPVTYYRKRVGESEFTRKEMQIIRSELNLSADEFDSIFFDDVLTQT